MAKYFEQMQGKQKMKVPNPRYQKMLDENRERRNIMQRQFS